MKTFKELQEGDKIYIYAYKPYIATGRSTDYCVSELFISGIYEIKTVKKMGFCIRFSLSDIIGSKIHTYVNTNDLILSAKNGTYIERTLSYYDIGEHHNYRQNITITTSEEEWLEKMEEN